MVSIRVKKSEANGEYGSLEAYLREEHGLRDGVTLDRHKDGGMYGNRIFVFSLPDGEEEHIKGYASQPPVATYSLAVWGDRAERLFGE